MVNASEIYGSGGDFLNVDLARSNKLLNKWLTIKEAEVRTMNEKDFTTGEEKTVKKIVLTFNEMDFELPLNKTNARRLIADISPESDNWVNRPIKLKVQTWGNGKEGLVIKSKQELEDDGDELPSSPSLEPNQKEIDSERVLVDEEIKFLKKKNEHIYDAIDTLQAGQFDITKPAISKELTKMRKAEELSADDYKKAREDLKLK
jgi:hypothetical protein